MTMQNFYNSPVLLDGRFVERCVLESQRTQQDLSTLLFPVAREADDRDLVDGCIAMIRVYGSLYPRGWRSYELIQAQFEAALKNDRVKGIVFDIDSPGGAVHGCMDLADFIYNNRSVKPTLAIANETACSGAFALGSACEELVVARTADVGSVGVVAVHWDYAGALEKWGEKPTLIYAGSHKVDGNPFGPLPDSVRELYQAQIDEVYGIFVDTVARNRKMTADAVRQTEALVYRGEHAVEAGFADRVTTARDALQEFSKKLQSRRFTGMKIAAGVLKQILKAQGKTDEEVAKLELPADDATEVEIDDVKLSAGTPEPATPAPTPAPEVSSERDRISKIMNSEHAKDRPALARTLALDTEMTVEQAEKVMQASAKEAAADPLSAAMNRVDQPEIGEDGGAGGGGGTKQEKIATDWDTALKLSGAKLKKSA